MAKRKDRQYNGQKKGQTIQWPKERTDNTMTKRKDRQYNGQKKGQTIQWPLKIPKGGNQNPYIDEEQTTQWPKKKHKGQTTIYKTCT
jgi:hypothetical protein